jgi:hypothetical protein
LSDNAPTLSTGYLDRRSLVVGATLPIFIAYPYGQKRPAEPVVWTISDEAVAMIRPEESLHEIVGLRPGTATVRARQGIHDCVETFHVVDPANVKSVGLELDDYAAQAANRFQLVATAFYEHGCWQVITADPAVAWSSSDESIARISSSGVVLGQRDGDARISIAFKGCSAHRDVHIEDGVLAIFSDGLFDCGSFVRLGVTTSLFPYFWATVRNWRPRSGAVTLSAEPTGIVELMKGSGESDNWTVRGLRVGAAAITVRLGTLQRERTIEVREAKNPRFDPIGVEAADDRIRLNLLFIGEESAAHTYLRDDGGSIYHCRDIVWSSSAPEILSVTYNKQGDVKVKAVAAGDVTLRAECKPLGVTQERQLRVAEEPHIEWF